MTETPSEPNGNGRRVNWSAARAYWLALPEERRTFTEVGRRFHVSGERVGQIARRDGWAKALEELQRLEDVELERELRKRVRGLARNRADRIVRTLEAYDRVNDAVLEALPLNEKGELDEKAIRDLRLESVLSSMPGLFKMAELAAGEATDRVAIADVQPVLIAFARIAVLRAPAAERSDVVRELEQASAGLVTLDAGG